MNSSKENSWEHQQQVIDAKIQSVEQSIRAEIKSLEDTVLALTRRRNALAPISSLPTEVIAAIFFLLRNLRLFGSDGRPKSFLALRVAQVCHQWREIALENPLLWSHFDFSTVSPAGATEILARAKMTPLSLEAIAHSYRHWDDGQVFSLQKELQTHIFHTCHLSLGNYGRVLNKILEGLIFPAPILETLSLSAERTSRASVPDTLFDGAAPKLSSLQLSDCDINWKSPLLKGLKNLEIRRLSEAPRLTDWLDALEEMPQLERLVIDSASPRSPPPPFPYNPEYFATLPSLSHLDIYASVFDCGFALSHLILPVLTSLCVTASPDPRSDHLTARNVKEISPYISKHSHGRQDTQPLQSVFIHKDFTRLDILAWQTPHADVPTWEQERSTRVELSFTTNDESGLYFDNYVEVLGMAMDALSLRNLVMLTSPCNTRLDMYFWRDQAASWPLLERVDLAPRSARGFMEMLLEDDGGREHPLLPSLTYLRLIGSSLSVHRFFCLVRDALMKRVEQGVPLEVLDLRMCSAPSLVVRLLSEIVVHVWGPTESEMETEKRMDGMWMTRDGVCCPFSCDYYDDDLE